MERIIKIITIILFAIIIAGSGVGVIANSRTKYSEFEKRELAPFPKTNVKTITSGKFQSGLDDFLNDHVALRDECISVNTMVGRIEGKKEQNGVVFGSDGYLFEKYQDKDFSKKDIDYNVAALSEFVNLVAENIGEENVKVALVPSKINVLDSKLPKFAPKSRMNDYMKKQLSSSLTSEDILLDLSGDLAKHSDEYIYYKTDHHWTSLGAYYGYEAIMKGMGDKVFPKGKEKVITKNFRGTTFNKVHYAASKDIIRTYGADSLNVAGEIDENGDVKSIGSVFDTKALDSEDKYDYFLGGNYAKVTLDTDCKNDKTLILIKDSFANCMVPFLSKNYSKIVMIDLRYLNSSIMDSLADVETIDSLLVLFNDEKFMQDSHMDMLG